MPSEYIERIIKQLAGAGYSSRRWFFGYSLWIGLIPPVCAFFGTWRYGWPLGVAEPLVLSFSEALTIALLYAVVLIAGFLSTVAVVKWMAATYTEEAGLDGCFGVVSVAGTPIMLGGVAHLYPNILFHILALAPLFALSTYLLFISIPVLLKTNQDRGIFMGCAVLGYLVATFLALLGLSVFLWVNGIGPDLGV